MHGPASPRIEKDFEGAFLTILTWSLSALEGVSLLKAAYNRSVRVKVRAAREVDGLFRPCRSCVHSASTLPALGLEAEDFGAGLKLAEELRCVTLAATQGERILGYTPW